MFAYGDNIIHFGLRASLWKMSHAKMGNASQKISHHALSEATCEVAEMRSLQKPLPVKRHLFLKPACSESVVTEA